MTHTADVAIVGGGIVGLAHALAALKKGHKVVLFERDHFAVGASVRNFGLVWPIGQEPGKGLELATKSREIWQEVARESGIWCNPNGSLQLAYEKDEWSVLEEFASMYQGAGYDVSLIGPKEVGQLTALVNSEGLKGALWSRTEMTVYSREAIRRLPVWMEERYGLVFRPGHVVTSIEFPALKTSLETWHVGRVVICSGADFETLYPEIYNQRQLTKCKLQMMKLRMESPKPIGPSLCAGLTLRHYAAFSKCKSLDAVNRRYNEENPDLEKYGIHILVSQNERLELIVGDSHLYYQTVEPFDLEKINKLIVHYFEAFVNAGKYEIVERWNGTYPKCPGHLYLSEELQPGVQIINGLGGAGMTLSFGIADLTVSRW